MARSAPTSPPLPTAGGTYVVSASGALECVQQTAEATAEISPEPVITTEESSDAVAHS